MGSQTAAGGNPWENPYVKVTINQIVSCIETGPKNFEIVSLIDQAKIPLKNVWVEGELTPDQSHLRLRSKTS